MKAFDVKALGLNEMSRQELEEVNGGIWMFAAGVVAGYLIAKYVL